jgi:ABC-type Fe3+/spermidine/putrescine transport system ATPase subunit
MNAGVAIENLSLARGNFRLGPLSFAVPPGGRFAIVGPSGSGKTTLLRCLAGLERADSGRITIGERVVAERILGERGVHAPPDQRGLGLVFQDGALWPWMTALQHLRFAAPKLDATGAELLLARAGLAGHAHKKPAALSGGEAQRLGVLRAIAPAPSVLLLDEPLRSVDVHQRDAMVLLLRTLADERRLTTILVTHDRDEALALATDLVVLHEGKLVEQGPALQLLQAPTTAFTAAFLAGAACLPTVVRGNDLETPFGLRARPSGATGDLRLVLLPGDVAATADDGRADRTDGGSAGGPRGRILSAVPSELGFRLRVALGEHIVPAVATRPLLPGDSARLSLVQPGRLLPWQPAAHNPPTA